MSKKKYLNRRQKTEQLYLNYSNKHPLNQNSLSHQSPPFSILSGKQKKKHYYSKQFEFPIHKTKDSSFQ